MGKAKRKALARLPPRARDSWWFDFEIDRTNLAVFRILFFGVLAVDAFLQIAHAPRYGAGDFNVPHLAWLPLPEPDRAIIVTIHLTLAYLFVLAASGVATRVVVPIAAALDFYAYFSSQLDSYQHHYLVVLLLVIASFIPWHDRSLKVKSWALRLFCVQVAILYIWAAIAKLDPLWLDGSTLSRQVSKRWVRDLIDGVGFPTVAWLVVLAEAALATAWLWRRLWIYACAIGIAFHLGIEASGFKIGQFSYLMVALYSLMLPRLPVFEVKLPELKLWQAIVALVAAFALGAALIVLGHVPSAKALVVIFALCAAGAFALVRHWRVAAAHLAACTLIFGLAKTTDQLFDYYRFWGGAARRLGKNDEARAVYAEVIAIRPTHPNAHWALGMIELDERQYERAIPHFQRAAELEPSRARGWVGIARAQLGLGRAAEARHALEQALRADPADQDAHALQRSLPPP